MHDNPNHLSRAVVLFLGFGLVPSPVRNRDRLIKEFGTEKGFELETLVISLIDEIGRIDVDWSIHSLESAGKLARAEMHGRYPELSETALQALKWKFSYDWR